MPRFLILGKLRIRLNPCCNGRGSKTRPVTQGHSALPCLNPCCNGRGSKTLQNVVRFHTHDLVLILVVMEEGQRHMGQKYGDDGKTLGLNPCCNGRGSKTA